MKQNYFRLLFSMLVLIGVGLAAPVSAQIIKSSPKMTALVGEQYTYNVNVFPLGDSAFFLDTKPAGMVINQTTGLITWNPTAITQGAQVSVRVTVGTFSDTQTFYVYISDAVSCDPSMISYWKLEETTGTTFVDFKGGYNAVTGVAPDDTIGRIGIGQKFDPARDIRLSSADNVNQYDWNQGDDISASLWFRNNVDISSSTGPQVFLGRLGATGNTATQHWWWFGLDTNNYVSATFTNNQGTLADTVPGYPNTIEARSSSGVHFNDNAWHHAVFTLSGDASNFYTLKIYVDGELTRTATREILPGNFTSTADLNFGWWQNPWGGKFFEYQGLMDEVAFYKKALSASEVMKAYNDGIDGLPYCQPGNYAPLFKSAPVTAATEDAVYTYSIVTGDFDTGNDLTITKIAAPAWLTTFTDNGNGTATLSGTPLNEHVGDNPVAIRVNDGTVDIDQIFTIVVANTSDAPTFTSTAVLVANEDALYTYAITTSDVDAGSTVSISAVSTLPAWLHLVDNGNGTATLSGTPANSDIGTVNVTLKVTDNTTASAEQAFSIVVSNVNNLPVITGQLELSTNEDVAIAITLDDLEVTDIDNVYPDDFELTVLDGTNYTHSGNVVTPAENWNGTLPVNIQLSDLTSDITDIVSVEVVSVNDIPEFISVPVTEGAVGTAYEYWIEAQDVEDEVLIFEVITKPSWMAFSYNTSLKLGFLQGTPAATDPATSPISIKVTDGDEGSIIQNYDLHVAGGVTGIDDNQGDAVKMYPSPVVDFARIEFGKGFSKGSVQIISLAGVLVKEFAIGNETELTLDLSDISEGVYVYKVLSTDKQIVGKFVIK